MKIRDVKDITTKKLSKVCLENMFDIFVDNTVLDDQYYFNLSETVVVPFDLTDSSYFDYYVSGGDTYPLLAFRFYGDVRAWWLICKANNILDPTSHPTAGKKLKIFNRNVAREILGLINDK